MTMAQADVRPGELVVDIGAGSGAISIELIRRGARVIAVEADPVWGRRLDELAHREADGRLRIVRGDFFAWPLPDRPYRVVACPPFGSTTAIMRRLLDDPEQPLCAPISSCSARWPASARPSRRPPWSRRPGLRGGSSAWAGGSPPPTSGPCPGSTAGC